MDIYSILLIILTILSLMELIGSSRSLAIGIITVTSKKKTIDLKQGIIVLIAVTLTLVSALRGLTIGRDLINYIPRYSTLGSSDWGSLFTLADRYSFEYGFAVFCKLLYMIDPDPGFFLIVTSVIIGLGFYKFSKLSKLPLTTFFIIYSFGLYGSSMNIVRQFLAFSIFVFGIRFLTERKLIKYILVVLLAMSIHTMSILYFLLYCLYIKEFDRKSLIILIGISGILAVIGPSFLGAIISRTSFAWYLSGLGKGSGESTLVLLSFILIGAYIYRKKIFEIDKQDNLCMWGLAIAIVFNSMALSFAIFARIMTFFTPFMAILVPDLVYALKKKGTNVYILLGILMICFYIFYYMYVLMGETGQGVSEAWYPYMLR